MRNFQGLRRHSRYGSLQVYHVFHFLSHEVPAAATPLRALQQLGPRRENRPIRTILSRAIAGIKANSIRTSMWGVNRRLQDQPSTPTNNPHSGAERNHRLVFKLTPLWLLHFTPLFSYGPCPVFSSFDVRCWRGRSCCHTI